MKLELLTIGAETEKLRACQLSLLLGVYTQNNQIANFLKVACSVLKMGKGILIFEEEPYGWHFSQNYCSAFSVQLYEEFRKLFLDEQCINADLPNYYITSSLLNILKVEHNRYAAIQLVNNNQIIGYAVFFDDDDMDYEHSQLPLAIELAQNLIEILNLRLENAELKEIYEQESALNFSKTKFFQIIAHDLRAPFHGLLGFSEVLARERDVLDEDNIQEISDYLFDTAQSTYNLLESLLNWAMAEGGRFVCHPVNFDISQSGQIVTEVLGGLAINKSIKLINQIKPNTKVHADINMITSVIQNLVSNALKFTPIDGSGEVILSAEQTEDYVYIYILDTGLGMSQSQIETLFEPKLTISIQGTRGEKGAGLGLVLCKRFIDLNHGTISVTSKEGEGTKFKVGLPNEKIMKKI